jgi:hypothetical protein
MRQQMRITDFFKGNFDDADGVKEH